MINLTNQPIDIQRVVESVANDGAGAVNVFIGTVRDSANEKKVLRLEYEAYDAMSIPEIQKIIDMAAARWPLLGCAVSHRVGTLAPGEVSVVVAVSTPHRKESFEACQYVIDTLKATVPIWKKEVCEDGHEWIAARPNTNAPL